MGFRRNSPDDPRLGLTKHRFSHDPSRPSSPFFFEPRCTNANFARQHVSQKRGFQQARRSLRQHLQRAAHNHNQVPAFCMPRHALHRLRIEWDRHSCLTLSFCIFSCLNSRAQTARKVCPTTFHIHWHAPQIHLVCVHDLTDPPRREPHRSREPQEIISNPNDPPKPQHRKKLLLHRRPWHQRPIQIKKRRNVTVLLLYFPFLLLHHHNAPCAILFTPRTWPTPETKRHPSANTGNARNKQNAAVIHVST